MTLARGRVSKDAGNAEPVASTRTPAARAHIVAERVLEARAEAARIVAEARARAEAILAEAELAMADARVRAEAEGRAEGVAKVAARALALAQLEARSDERQLERTVELARVLAERLLGEALALDPKRVLALARQALGEARGARRIQIVAHPADAAILTESLAELTTGPNVLSIEMDDQRARGDLRLVTDIGILDAELAPQLARLTLKLRETLQHER
ncbi:MAG TPA: FliH/SctL family protein [Polyangiaceae bacterium]|nr:FliH/SctL family protein [Polyangiaceae bacterium]